MIPGSANPLLLAGAEAGYAIDRSIRLNSADSAYLNRTPSTAGNRKTWTWAGWVKITAFNQGFTPLFATRYNTSPSANGVDFRLNSDTINFSALFNTFDTCEINTTQVFRDPSAWYHIVLAFDTTQSTASNRIRLYVNGNQVTQFSTAQYPTLDYGNFEVNSTVQHTIGCLNLNGTPQRFLDACLADIHFCDGYAYDPSYFTEFDDNGILQPIAFTGSYGTNGFHLDFADNSTAAALGTDTSGNGNDWAINNISVSDGTVPVASATGGLPVYNTTDTYGTTKGSGTRTDSNSGSLVLALPMQGANNGTVFTDESVAIKGSGSAKSFTVTGNAKTSTAQSKYYGSSGYFDGSGDYLLLDTATTNEIDSWLLNSGSKTGTFECWIYPTAINQAPSLAYTHTSIYNRGATYINWGLRPNGTVRFYWYQDALSYVDSTLTVPLNQWSHIAVTIAGGTVRHWINGTSAGSGSFSYVTQDIGANATQRTIGYAYGQSASEFTGYIQDLRIYNGVAKYTSNFTPPSSTLNLTLAAGNDSLVDVPTNGTETDTGVGGEVRGNYATLNPLDTDATLSNGNLDVTFSGYNDAPASIAIQSGKFYFEGTAGGSASNWLIGMVLARVDGQDHTEVDANRLAYNSDGTIRLEGISQSTLTGQGTYGSGDVIGIALDVTNGSIAWYKNGSLVNTVTNSGISSDTWKFYVVANTNGSWTTNFGQRPFAYTAPSGFKALCTANLPAPVVTKPSEYMDVKLYTGNGGTNAITGLSFSPDLVWLKGRSTSSLHNLYDVIRGRKALFSSSTNAELSLSAGVDFGTFNSDGFTLLTPSATAINNSGQTFVAWTWDAGSSTVSNTDGSITSSVRANPSAGFSIVTYTGTGTTATVGHGLGAAPSFLICKNRNGTNPWVVYHRSISRNGYLLLNTTAAFSSLSDYWGTSEPSSTVVSFDNGGYGGNNFNGLTYVMYAFAPVDGYSNGFSYTGNGSADGSFVYLGFRPRLILLKCSSTTGNWTLVDTAREGYNVDNDPLYPNLSNAEGTTDLLDITSNGFKLRTTDASVNSNAATYIGFAWAESPFNYSRAR